MATLHSYLPCLQSLSLPLSVDHQTYVKRLVISSGKNRNRQNNDEWGGGEEEQLQSYYHKWLT